MIADRMTLTLDQLRELAPTLARVVTNVGTYQDHVNAMAELNMLLRRARGKPEPNKNPVKR